jgi:hypothetical protein
MGDGIYLFVASGARVSELPFVGINLARAQRGSILCPKEEEKEKTELTREIERFIPNFHPQPSPPTITANPCSSLYLPVPLLT